VLQMLHRHVDFAALAAAIDRAAPRPGRARGGRPPFPTEMMVRTLLLQQLYNLSDEWIDARLLLSIFAPSVARTTTRSAQA
jgi:hypothetical protein